MNRSIIVYVTGRFLLLFAALLLIPLVVSILYAEGIGLALNFLVSSAISLGLGLALSYKKPKEEGLFAREGLVICALIWILMSFIGALPLVFSKTVSSLVDGFFEMSSGFTTTGASIMQQVENLPHSILFWRSFSHLIGGMGVLVFALTLMPKVDAEAVHIMKAEVPGPVFGKLKSSIVSTARLLYIIYLVMTAVLIVVLALLGMPFFDAVCHAFGAAGTGGFGIKNNSIAYYNSSAIHIVLAVAMLLFGINFNLYYILLLKKVKQFFSDEELKTYFAIVLVAVVLISLNLYNQYKNIGILIRDVFFTVSSLITTTGYSTVNFNTWPVFSKAVLIILMFIGGMAGSTAGGLKVLRVLIYSKSARAEQKRQREPGRIAPVTINGKTVSADVIRSMLTYLTIYLGIFMLLLMLVSLDSQDFGTAFSAVVASFNNIGPGIGQVGPDGNFSHFTPIIKLVLSLGMIAGRLEIWPVIILLSRKTWHKT
ncbi:MAG: TrkH family potassium uptake protein [Eubacteriales bacterium]|nr:TrkH family potassium uptake protein [Eubacteriales bacterium]